MMDDIVRRHLFDTPIGPIGLAWSDRGIVAVVLPEGSTATTLAALVRRSGSAVEAMPTGFAADAATRIAALLAGAADDLADLPLDLKGGSAFERRVWAATREVGPGTTTTYGALAARIGDPGAARAVGAALGRNPVPPVVPCHRVLAAGGGHGGFSAPGGVATKRRMLAIEGVRLDGGPGLFEHFGVAMPDGPAPGVGRSGG